MGRLPTLLALAVAYAGCIGTTVPQPPNHEPIEPDLVTGVANEMEGTVLRLAGTADAAHPNAELWIWDLETTAPPIVAATDLEGRFEVDVPVPAGELRMQTRNAEGRSDPTDLIAGPEGSVPAPRDDCFRVTRALRFDGRSAELLIVNHTCPEEVSLLDLRLRAGAAFDIERPTELLMPPGAQTMIRIDAPGTEPVEDILFLTMDIRGSPIRYPVTISAP